MVLLEVASVLIWLGRDVFFVLRGVRDPGMRDHGEGFGSLFRVDVEHGHQEVREELGFFVLHLVAELDIANVLSKASTTGKYLRSRILLRLPNRSKKRWVMSGVL